MKSIHPKTFAVAKKDLPVVAMVTEAEPDVNLLLTDYLIVGAGAMGLGFLDELINSSTDMEAIIVDTRSALECDGDGGGDGHGCGGGHGGGDGDGV